MKDSKNDILEFWFHDTKPAQWFQENPAFDDLIRTRFGSDYELAAKGIFDGWMDSGDGCLALVILLDQFPRNMFRGRSVAFATDERAMDVTRHALEKRYDMILDPHRRAFLYMPFQHAEDLIDHDRSVALYALLKAKNPVYFDHAVRQRDTIVRFGRFPIRNAALGRQSTPQEAAYLTELTSRS